MAPTIDFYYFAISPPSRAVWMVLEELGLKYNEHLINIRNNEQKTPEFKEISFRQKVPAIKEGEFVLAESRAVAGYLVSQYGEACGKQDIYPKDPKKRAVVDQHLYISENLVGPMMGYTNIPGVLFGDGLGRPEKIGEAKSALQTVETLLTNHTYTAADHFTLADIFYYIITGLLGVTDFDCWGEFPKVVAWRKKMAALPSHKKTCEEPLAKMRALYQEKLKENAAKQQSK